MTRPPDVTKPRANGAPRNANDSRRVSLGDACRCMQHRPCWTCKAWRRLAFEIFARQAGT